MSDKRDKDFVQHSIDTGLASMEGNPFLAQRILNQERTDKPIMKKKFSFAFVLVMIMLFVFAATAVAAVVASIDEEFNAYLYQRWPEAALKLMPVDMTCEDKGFRLEVTSASVHNDEVLISYSVQDLEGDRLESTSIYPQVRCAGNPVTSWTGAESYDETERKLYSAEYAKCAKDIAETDAKSLTLEWQAFSHYTYHNLDLFSSYRDCREQTRTTSELPAGLVVNAPYVSPDSMSFAESGLPENMQIIDPESSLEIPLYDSVYLSGIKLIDGWLHIQLHYTDLSMRSSESGNYFPYAFNLMDYDDEGNETPYFTDSMINAYRELSWGLNTSSYRSEWVEIVFPVETEELEKAASIPARIDETVDMMNATCKVDIPLRLITKEE